MDLVKKYHNISTHTVEECIKTLIITHKKFFTRNHIMLLSSKAQNDKEILNILSEKFKRWFDKSLLDDFAKFRN